MKRKEIAASMSTTAHLLSKSTTAFILLAIAFCISTIQPIFSNQEHLSMFEILGRGLVVLVMTFLGWRHLKRMDEVESSLRNNSVYLQDEAVFERLIGGEFDSSADIG